jgi:Mg-chelatase subunit ChlD
MALAKLRFLMTILIALLFVQGMVYAYDPPFINPLDDLDAYDSLDYWDISDLSDPWDLGYWENDDEFQELYIWGNVWIMGVYGDSLQDFDAYLTSLEGTILKRTETLLVAQINGPEGLWWAYAERWGDDYYGITVIQEQEPTYEEEYYEEEYYEEEYYFPTPLINPLENPDVTGWTVYYPADDIEIPYYDSHGYGAFYYGLGELWSFGFSMDHLDQVFEAVQEQIRKLGGEVLESSRAMLSAAVVDSEGYRWQVILSADSEDSFMLQVTKELYLQPNQTITIKPGKDQSSIGFITDSDGLLHKTLVVEISDAGAWLSGSYDASFGEYERSWSGEYSFDSEKTSLYLLDDMLQEPGRVAWTFTPMGETMPEKITVSLKESVPLPPLTLGDQLGILKISGAEGGEVSVRPSHSVSMSIAHEYYDTVGDQNPDGDWVFYLPPGYWDIEQHYGGFIKARMVPVNSGQITAFTLPSVTQAAFEESVESVQVGGALELSRHSIQGSRSDLDFVFTPLVTGELVPSRENVEISEGGLMGKVISIEPIVAPPDIVLLLDSSGSMRAQMEQTLATAREFINSLSDDTKIRVIDFDTQPKLLAGTTKTEVLASLASVRADGATCLYDSILEGLSLLEGDQRPVLVVFTDGVDANYDDSGPGSVATLSDVTQAVQASSTPLYTIGFGPGHDKTVLQQVADLSGGRYFAAVDQNALNEVFSSINALLSNAYRLVYERPTVAGISNVPVVSIMVDQSGSMDMDPAEEGCGYRMQKVKNVLHDFVLDLPEQTLIQVQTFDWYTTIQQSMTLDKASALYVIGQMNAGGATDTLGSIQLATQTLSITPSKNKVLVYITDAAIAMESEEEQESLYELVDRMAKAGIKVIWIGIGMDDSEAVFADIAARSEGRYVISEDSAVLTAALNEVLAEMKDVVEESSTVDVLLSLEDTSDTSLITRYMGNLTVPYAKFAQREDVIELEVASYHAAGSAADVKELSLYGLDAGNQQAGNIQTRFIPLDVGGASSALALKVTGATATNVLAGLSAPGGRQFLSLDLALENILEPQEVVVDAKGNNHPGSWMSNLGDTGRTEFRVPDYLIPHLASHLYLGWNDEQMYPVSPASWLDPSGLLVPGDMSLTVYPQEPLQGTLVFLVDDESIAQMSLHFYDTAYGHLNLDLIGAGNYPELDLSTFPTTEPSRLSDVFELRVVAVDDVLKIGNLSTDGTTVFRMIEVDLTSQVQALLDIDPAEVFSLRIPTDSGVFFIPLHPLTASVPLGFADARMVAPGSFNKVRFVFEIPQALAENGSELFVDLRQDDLVIPLSDLPAMTPSLPGNPILAEGIKLYVNHIGWTSEGRVVADLTFVDELDGYATGLTGGFKLVRDDYAGISSEVDSKKLVTEVSLGSFTESGEVFYELSAGSSNADLVLGFEDAVVKDGMTRRTLISFDIPMEEDDHQWTLRSDIFADLNQVVPDLKYLDPELLTYLTTETNRNLTFEQELEAAINMAIRDHQARQAAKGQLAKEDRMDLLGESIPEETLVPPSSSAPGMLALESVSSFDDLLKLLSTLTWLPSADRIWEQRYAPAAVLTQMWGTESDLAGVAENVLQRLGYNPQQSLVDLTPAGLEFLAELSGIPNDQLELTKLPAVKYSESGEDRLLVLPFAADVSELTEYVSIPIRRLEIESAPVHAEVRVFFDVIPKGSGIGGQFGDFASVLGGGEDQEEIESHLILRTSLPLTDLSLDAVDLVYVSAGFGTGELFTAVLETSQGRVVGEEPVDSGEYEIRGATIEIITPEEQFKHQFMLKEDQNIDKVAHTIAINSPDIPRQSALQLEQIADTLYQSVDIPDSLSVYQWYARSIINRFIVAQTETEQDLAQAMDLVIGRTRRPRVIVLTVANDSARGSIRSSINLLSAANDIHSGDFETRRAFSTGSGLMASSSEAKALGEGIGVFEIWGYLPDDATMLWISTANLPEALEILEEADFSKTVRDRIAQIENKVVVIPLEQVILDGVLRTAWLEIDEATFYTIGVLDSGEYGAMIESAVQNFFQSMNKYYVGAVFGVNSMVWGVSSFSLVYDDYNDILTAAAQQSIEMAKTIKKSVEELAKIDPRQVKSIMAKAEKTALGLANSPGQFLKDEAKARIVAKAQSLGQEKADEFLPDITFVGGVLDGVELYLEYAKP